MKKWEEIISDEMLKLASERLAERQGEKYYREAIKLNSQGEEAPTREQIKNFKKLCKRQFRQKEKFVMHIYKIAATAAMLLILFNVSAVSVPAVREVVVDILESTSKVYKGALKGDRQEGKYKIEFDREYHITYLPDEYRIINEIRTRFECVTEYCNELEERIIFTQSSMKSGSETNTGVNKNPPERHVKKKSGAEKVIINGKEAFLSNKDEQLNITWEENGYSISISADRIDKDRLIKIAESVKRTK